MLHSNEKLAQRIRAADTHEAVDALLKKGEAFAMASSRTRRRWKYNAAKARNDIDMQKVKKAANKRKELQKRGER